MLLSQKQHDKFTNNFEKLCGSAIDNTALHYFDYEDVQHLGSIIPRTTGGYDSVYVLLTEDGLNNIVNQLRFVFNQKARDDDTVQRLSEKEAIDKVLHCIAPHMTHELFTKRNEAYKEAILQRLPDYIPPENPNFDIYDWKNKNKSATELPNDVCGALLSPTLSNAIDEFCFYTKEIDYRWSVLYDKELCVHLDKKLNENQLNSNLKP